ncbi:uncharacterized protein LOC110852862 [Folsomia candida]|uniref:uncharacterized protein LOC110852862 n=1 Tax=Folsomia candida TaxID=158441 RepID=UPI000B8F8D85|nr:uncharacterized protein LOC110852862 [Folsomia candida]
MVPTQRLITRMERRLVTVGFVLILLAVTLPWGIEGCASRSGWGAPPPPVIVLPKPTLIPKLIAAFQDGKNSVSVKKGPPLGWVGISPQPALEINGLGWAPQYEDGFHRYGDHQRGFLVGQKHVGHGANHGVNYASHFANYDIGPFPIPHDFGIN